MARLPLNDWLPYAPEERGTVRVNHNSSDCSGGRDSMTITRYEDGRIFAYCFRCGGRGNHNPTRHFKPGAALVGGYSASGTLAGGERSSPPRDSTGEWGRFPRHVKEWLLRGGVTSVISDTQGFLWSEEKERLWIPVRQYSKTTTGNKLAGWIERGFSPKSYLTRTDDKANFYGYYVSGSVINNSKVVLVEDVLSALKCSQVVDSIAITGVHPKESVIAAVLKNGYKQAYVFLDADNPTVRMKARQIPKRLPFVECKIVEAFKDPKSCSIEEIQAFIDGA